MLPVAKKEMKGRPGKGVDSLTLLCINSFVPFFKEKPATPVLDICISASTQKRACNHRVRGRGEDRSDHPSSLPTVDLLIQSKKIADPKNHNNDRVKGNMIIMVRLIAGI